MSDWRRWQANRRLLPGFPVKPHNMSRKEVEQYFSTEKIQCLKCGKFFHVLSAKHLPLIHGISVEEYRGIYGLPRTRGLVGRAQRAKFADNAMSLLETGVVAKFGPEARVKGLATRRAKGHYYPPFQMEEMKKRLQEQRDLHRARRVAKGSKCLTP